jgi:DNA-binding transcriptional regulator YiaG
VKTTTGSSPSSSVDITPADVSAPKAAMSLLFASSLALYGLLSGTTTTAPLAEPQVRYIGSWTSTARTMGAGAGEQRRPTDVVAQADPAAVAAEADARTGRTIQAAEVRWLREASGLTWEQMGRLFGVSRRAVHLWANGGRMNATNAELLGRLVALVRELPGGPDRRRAALLAPTADGTSIVDRVRARHDSDARDISGTPFRPEELLGSWSEGTAQT